MLKKFKDFTVIILSLLLLSAPAHALVEVPTLRAGIGLMPLSFTAGSVKPESTSLGSKLTLNPMFLWDIPSIRMRLGFHFLTDLGSQYGFVSTAGVGLTAIFYPLGLSSSREVKDDGSITVKTRVSPFAQVSITPTRFSITVKPEPSEPNYNNPETWDYFNANVIELSFGGGIDYPFSENIIGFLGLHYRYAAYTSLETTSGVLKYSGIGVLAGIMTNFY